MLLIVKSRSKKYISPFGLRDIQCLCELLLFVLELDVVLHLKCIFEYMQRSIF
jgi:hypothetical protein